MPSVPPPVVDPAHVTVLACPARICQAWRRMSRDTNNIFPGTQTGGVLVLQHGRMEEVKT